MCKAQKKLEIFSYILEKLVGLQKEKDPNYRDKSEDEVLRTFSNTRIMKLLYCLCLESLYNPDGDEINDNNLFNVLGSFNAFPNGPVLLDVYTAFDIIPGFDYKDGRFQKRNNQVVELRDEDKKLVDNSVMLLGKRMKYELFTNRDELVGLTHKLPMWSLAFMYSFDKDMGIAPELLKQEYQSYKQILPLQN